MQAGNDRINIMDSEYHPLSTESGITSKLQEEKLTKDNPSVHAAVDRGVCIFDTKAADIAISKSERVEYRPVSSITAGSTIEICIHKTESYYWDLRKSLLSVKCVIRKENGAAITKDDHVALVQAPGCSLFKSCELSLQQRTISPDVGKCYAEKCVIDLLLYSSEEYLESKAQSFLFYKDNTPMDGTGVSGDGVNNGLVARYQYTSEGKECTLVGPLGHDLWRVNQYIPSGIELRLQLIPNENNYVLMYGSPTERYKFEITKCTLLMHGVLPSDDVLAKHARLLASKEKAILHYTRSEIKTYTFTTGVLSFEMLNCFQNAVPYEVIVAFVGISAANGDAKKNPFNFLHLDINRISLKVEKYKTIDFTPNFTNFHCAEEYDSLYDHEDPYVVHGHIIKRHEYHQGYTLFRFVLGPALYERMARPLKGATSIEGTMSKAIAGESVRAYVYGRFHDYLLIDEDKRIHLGEG